MDGVSFVVTVYNKRDFLPGVVAGLAAQSSIGECEYIFVDDGSTDGSAELLDGLTGSLANSTILRQDNRGPAFATNRGIGAARHRWIKLVDGDDVLAPDGTSGLIEAAEAHGAQVAIGGLAFYDPASPHAPEPAGSAASSLIEHPFEALLRNMDTNPSAALIDASLARQIGGCDTRVFTQDYSLMLRAAGAGARFVKLDRVVAAVPSTAAGRISDNQAQILHDINAALSLYAGDHPELAPALQHLIARRAAARAWRWARRRNGASILSGEFLHYLLSKPGLASPLATVQASCAAFRRNTHIRVPSEQGGSHDLR